MFVIESFNVTLVPVSFFSLSNTSKLNLFEIKYHPIKQYQNFTIYYQLTPPPPSQPPPPIVCKREASDIYGTPPIIHRLHRRKASQKVGLVRANKFSETVTKDGFQRLFPKNVFKEGIQRRWPKKVFN